MARLFRAIALLVAAGLWAWAATLLWRTTVPELHPPHLDARSVFGGGLVARTARFDRVLRALWLVSVLAQLAAFALVVRRAPRLRLGRRRTIVAVAVAALAVAAAWAAALPPQAAGLWWTRRHGLSRQTYGGFLVHELVALAGTTAAACAAVAVCFWLASRLSRRWWIPAAALATGTALVYTLAVGALTAGRAPPPRVRAEERRLAAREGVSPPRVVVRPPPGRSRTANADAVGIGPTRRIALWRTLLRPPFGRREVRFVLAHELAHHARRHLWKGIAWFGLLALPALAAVDLAAPRLEHGWWAARALLVLFLAQLALLPLENAISRRYEAEADWRALVATRDPAAARALYRDFARTALLQPDPPAWSYAWLDTHPTLLQRVEQADAYERRATPPSRGGS